MSAPIAWLNQPIVHTTRHGWEVVAAQPWMASSIGSSDPPLMRLLPLLLRS